MTAALNTALRGAAGNMAPFAIGMTVAFCIMSFGAITGASLNPARTLGPAVGTGDYSRVIAYCIAQIAGAFVAAIFYRVVFAKKRGNEDGEPAF